MSDTTTGGPHPSAGIDLSQFYQVFFEEARENLERMEGLLLGLDIEHADDEELNAIFRCAHSIKGGAATFGFADTAELTHQMETLLDKLRRRERAPTAAMVDVLLRSGDALRAQLARHQGAGGERIDTTALLHDVRAFVAGAPPLAAARGASAAGPVAHEEAAPAAAAPGPRVLELRVGPLKRASDADELHVLFKEIPDLGTLEPLDGGHAADGIRRFRVSTTSSDSDLLDLFTFHVAREQLTLLPLDPGDRAHAAAPPAAAPVVAGYGFFAGAPGLPQNTTTISAQPHPQTALVSPKPAARGADRSAAAAPEASTLRVSVEKVDQLINLVGELVITQAMLAQNSLRLDPALHRQLAVGLADLERNTRELQESVMSIRMMPMSIVFSRFPRMVRDLAGKLGKTGRPQDAGRGDRARQGPGRKDRRSADAPGAQLVDHGIELPAERIAPGQARTGHDHALGVASGRHHRDRGARRRRAVCRATRS